MPNFYPSPELFVLIPPFEDLVKPFETLAEGMPGKHDFLAQVQGCDDWTSFYSWLSDLYKKIPAIDLSWQEWAVVFDAWWGLKLSPLITYHTTDNNYLKLITLIVNDDRYLGSSKKVFGESSWNDKFGEHYKPSKPMKNLLEKLQFLHDQDMIDALVLKCIHFWWFGKRGEASHWMSNFATLPLRHGPYDPTNLLKELDLV